MKLMSFITAILISLSVFSQDLIEYNEGIFSRNGEELSIEQVEKLLNEYEAGWQAQFHLRNGVRYNLMGIREGRATRIGTGILVGAVGLSVSGFAYAVGDLIANPVFGAPGTGNQEEASMFYIAAFVGTLTTVISTITISSPEYWLNKKDKAFNKVKKELNSAILQIDSKQKNN